MKNSREPMVSVVVVGVNESRLIRECFESLIHQNFSGLYEIIYVDGGSTDTTLSIVDAYKHKVPLRVIKQKGRGIGDAREVGFKEAQASIIASTDADVSLPADWIERIYQNFTDNPNLLGVVGPFTFNKKLPIFQHIILMLCLAGDQLVNLTSGWIHFRGMNFAVRKSAWKQIEGFNTKISALEDVEFSYRLAKKGLLHYDKNLIVHTTDRRYRKNGFKFLIYRLHAYYYRVFMKDHSKYTEWEQIRDE